MVIVVVAAVVVCALNTIQESLRTAEVKLQESYRKLEEPLGKGHPVPADICRYTVKHSSRVGFLA